MPQTRRRFTSEFKSEAVKLLTEGGKPLQQVAAELGVHANQLRMLCRLVGVAVSGFYAWLRRGSGRHGEADRQLGERIGAIFAASRRTYGSPRVHAELRAQGVRAAASGSSG